VWDGQEELIVSEGTYRLLKPTYPPKVSNYFFLAAHVLTIGVGLAGLVGETAPSVNAVLGYDDIATILFAFLFIFFGGLALYGRLRRRMRVEATAVLTIAGAFFIWGIIVVIASKGPTTSLQPASGYFLVSALKIGWGLILFWWANQDLVVVPRLHIGATGGTSHDGPAD
jgi:hypothetical protein